jgi:2-polyprenyl-6-methoxyphenol hydroxylase-like FAD-dependent oxidoreductase
MTSYISAYWPAWMAEWRARLDGPPVREDVPSAGAPPDLSPCAGLSLSRDVLESVLREHVSARAAFRLRIGTALESFSTSADGVTATVRDTASGTVDRPLVAQARVRTDTSHSRRASSGSTA